MSFTASEIDQIEALLSGGQAIPDILAAFRSRFPGRSLTRCDASDLSGELPFRRLAKADLYLVDGRDHCWRITADLASATGLVLAAHAKRA